MHCENHDRRRDGGEERTGEEKRGGEDTVNMKCEPKRKSEGEIFHHLSELNVLNVLN